MRATRTVEIEKFKMELDKFSEFIPDEQEIPNYDRASGNKASVISLPIVGLKELQRRRWCIQLGHYAGLTSSKPDACIQ